MFDELSKKQHHKFSLRKEMSWKLKLWKTLKLFNESLLFCPWCMCTLFWEETPLLSKHWFRLPSAKDKAGLKKSNQRYFFCFQTLPFPPLFPIIIVSPKALLLPIFKGVLQTYKTFSHSLSYRKIFCSIKVYDWIIPCKIYPISTIIN